MKSEFIILICILLGLQLIIVSGDPVTLYEITILGIIHVIWPPMITIVPPTFLHSFSVWIITYTITMGYSIFPPANTWFTWIIYKSTKSVEMAILHLSFIYLLFIIYYSTNATWFTILIGLANKTGFVEIFARNRPIHENDFKFRGLDVPSRNQLCIIKSALSFPCIYSFICRFILFPIFLNDLINVIQEVKTRLWTNNNTANRIIWLLAKFFIFIRIIMHWFRTAIYIYYISHLFILFLKCFNIIISF